MMRGKLAAVARDAVLIENLTALRPACTLLISTQLASAPTSFERPRITHGTLRSSILRSSSSVTSEIGSTTPSTFFPAISRSTEEMPPNAAAPFVMMRL